VEKWQGRGIGLQNAKRRLELIYPGKHTLDIEDKDLTYKVGLKLLLS
jgi:LytS/YehU family sensor histidine kinase